MASSRFATLFKTNETYASALETIYELKPEVSFKVITNEYIDKCNEQAIGELNTLKSLEFLMFTSEDGEFNINAFESKLNSINVNFKVDKKIRDHQELFDTTIKTCLTKYEGLITNLDKFRQSYIEEIEPHKASLNQLLSNVDINLKVKEELKKKLHVEYYKVFASKYVTMDQPQETFVDEHSITLNLSEIDVSQYAGQSVFITLNTGLIFSVSSKYTLFVYSKDFTANGCYIQPICIDGRDKGPMFVHVYINSVEDGMKLSDEKLSMQFFSVSTSLIAKQGSTSLAEKDRKIPNNSIWNMNVPANQFVAHIEKHDPTEMIPAITFNPSNAAPIEISRSTFVILPRKRCMINDTILTPGGSMPKSSVVEPKCVTLRPSELKTVCITAPSKRNQFLLKEVTEFKFASQISGLNGNYADLPKYKELVKHIKKNSAVEDGIKICEKYAAQLTKDNSLTSDQEQRVLKMLMMMNPTSLCNSNPHFKKIVTAAKSDAVLDDYFITQLLSIKSDKRSLSDKKVGMESDLQELYSEIGRAHV